VPVYGGVATGGGVGQGGGWYVRYGLPAGAECHVALMEFEFTLRMIAEEQPNTSSSGLQEGPEHPVVGPISMN